MLSTLLRRQAWTPSERSRPQSSWEARIMDLMTRCAYVSCLVLCARLCQLLPSDASICPNRPPMPPRTSQTTLDQPIGTRLDSTAPGDERCMWWDACWLLKVDECAVLPFLIFGHGQACTFTEVLMPLRAGLTPHTERTSCRTVTLPLLMSCFCHEAFGRMRRLQIF